MIYQEIANAIICAAVAFPLLLGLLVLVGRIIARVGAKLEGDGSKDPIIAGEYRTHDGRTLPPIRSNQHQHRTRLTSYLVTEWVNGKLVTKRHYSEEPDT